MYSVRLNLGTWPANESPERVSEAIAALCDGLIGANRVWLAAHPYAPSVYQAGVEYRAEPYLWRDIADALQAKRGNCFTLSCWRIAELGSASGARPLVEWWEQPGKVLYHVQVLHRDGSIEDPSARLGMLVEAA